MFKQSEIVVSEPDIEAALAHLRGLPHRHSLPEKWDRQHFLTLLREAVSKRPKIGQCLDIAPGVYGIIKPFGVDLAGQRDPDFTGRLQVWLAIRSQGTDPERIVVL